MLHRIAIPGTRRVASLPLFVCALTTMAAYGAGTAPTFSEDVQPILAENCVVCHRPAGANYGGMVAPMSLQTYSQVRPWARAIAREVEARRMPPWHADPQHHGVFLNERTLTEDEIRTLIEWVRRGAPRGTPTDVDDEVGLNTESGQWQIGEPDLILTLPQPYFVGDEVEDDYVNFTSRIPLTQHAHDRWVQAFEFKPDSGVVHHMSLAPLGGVVPGTGPQIYREGHGKLLRAGQRIRFQMHYHKEKGPGTGVWDRSQVGVRFWPEGTVIDYPRKTLKLSSTTFAIPPGVSDFTLTESHTIEKPILLVGLLPHMHLRGKRATFTATYPNGREQVLLRVPNYDFNWQTLYEYREYKVLPAGTEIAFTAVWDNSERNPANPNPADTVYHGPATTDEMMLGSVHFTQVEPAKIVTGGSASSIRIAKQIDPALPTELGVSGAEVRHGMLLIRGWAVSPKPIREIAVDAGELGEHTAQHGQYRPDIYKSLPEYQAEYSGFTLALPLPDGLPGPDRVRIEVRGEDAVLAESSATVSR